MCMIPTLQSIFYYPCIALNMCLIPTLQNPKKTENTSILIHSTVVKACVSRMGDVRFESPTEISVLQQIQLRKLNVIGIII
jgi:hypothetical protein